MALDFAQVDSNGIVTGQTVRLDPRAHASIILQLKPGEFPLLYRMHEYYDDAEYGSEDLESLEKELVKCLSREMKEIDRGIVERMIELVLDSKRQGFSVEAIAD